MTMITSPALRADVPAARDSIRQMLERGRVVVLTGAGLSTACGIPDYRDADGTWRGATPVNHGDFIAHEAVRRRYWARSYVGWPRIADATPSQGHRVLAALEAAGIVALTVTQNVDGLQQRAGSRRVLELHGAIHQVRCLACATPFERSLVQEWLAALNAALAMSDAIAAPDGDAQLADASYRDFVVAPCPVCGGILKPDVVFFGGNVPRERVAATEAAIDGADGLLVIGSSLMVFSGFRFADYATKRGTPVMAINLGRTRADALFTAKAQESCDDCLTALADLTSLAALP